MRFLQIPKFSHRFLKTHLQLLQRPLVWGSTALIVLAGYLFFEYWKKADQLTSGDTTDQATSDSDAASLAGVADAGDLGLLQSNEERAIAADIDSLPLLLSEFKLDIEAPAVPSPLPTPLETVSSPSEIQLPTSAPVLPMPLPANSSAFPAVSTAPLADQSAFNLERPEFGQGLTPSNPGAIVPSSPAISPAGDRSEMSSSPNLATETNTTQPPRSALQQAMDGIGTPAASSPTPLGATAPTQPLMPSSAFQSTPILPSQPAAAPASQTSPPLGSTGYITPPALRAGTARGSARPIGAASSNQTAPTAGDAIAPAPSFNVPAGITPLSPGLQQADPSASGVSGAIAPAPPAPFSIPRDIPGRPIGNGEINTFSNP
jgi:hypothetical protein